MNLLLWIVTLCKRSRGAHVDVTLAPSPTYIEFARFGNTISLNEGGRTSVLIDSSPTSLVFDP